MPPFRQDLLLGISVVAASVLLFWNTYSFPPPLQPNVPGPAMFPRIIVGIMFLQGILFVERSLRDKRKRAGATGHRIVSHFRLRA